MQTKKGKHTKEEGPIKGFLMGLSLIIIIGGLALLFGSGDVAGFVWIVIGGVVMWLASKIRDKNVLRW